MGQASQILEAKQDWPAWKTTKDEATKEFQGCYAEELPLNYSCLEIPRLFP